MSNWKNTCVLGTTVKIALLLFHLALNLSAQSYIKPIEPKFDGKFGASVSVSGDLMAVGSPDADVTDDGVFVPQGGVYIFRQNDNESWEQEAILFPTGHDRRTGELRFGYSVALAGNILMVGAPGESGDLLSTAEAPNNTLSSAGAVFTFTRTGSGNWIQTAYIKASNPDKTDQFGYSIDFDGTTLLVGAPFEDGDGSSTVEQPNNNGSTSGAAYIFERAPTGLWQQKAYLKAANAEEFSTFGNSVSLDSGLLCIGGGEAEDPNGPLHPDVGAVYVYSRSQTGIWEHSAILTSPASETSFGNSVAIRGETIVAGSPSEDMIDPSSGNSLGAVGAAYVFEINEQGEWQTTARLQASNAAYFDQFGVAVALSETSLAVSAPFEDTTVNNSGAVYLFQKNDQGTWSETKILKASNPGDNDWLGASISSPTGIFTFIDPGPLTLSGNTVFAGCGREDGNANSTSENPNDFRRDSGAVYIFPDGNSLADPIYIEKVVLAEGVITLTYKSSEGLNGWKILGSETLSDFDEIDSFQITEVNPGTYEAKAAQQNFPKRFFLKVAR